MTAGTGFEPHGTTILCVRRNGVVAMGGDGQVTLGNTVMKGNARKVRRLHRSARGPRGRSARGDERAVDFGTAVNRLGSVRRSGRRS